MDYNNDCSFCQEINNKTDYSFFEIYLKDIFKESNLENRIIAETNNFILMPMVGPLVPGYILIVSKKHFLSFAHLPKEYLPELLKIKNEVKRVLSDFYTKPVFFEHGPMSEVCRGGACSIHAHMHCVSVDVDIYEKLKEKHVSAKEIDFPAIFEKAKLKQPYLFYENQKEMKLLIDVSEIASQYIRKLIAEEINDYKRYEWSNNIRYDWMIDLIKNVKPHFEKLKGRDIWK